MNPCPEYESHILDYSELAAPDRLGLDTHLTGCAGCSEFLATLDEVDTALARTFAVDVSPTFAPEVLRRARRPPVKPSVLPEVFDMIGWASLLTVLFAAAFVLAPRGMQDTAMLAAFALVIVCGSAWFVIEGWRELEKP
jgi:anti-sigma factor RsiW